MLSIKSLIRQKSMQFTFFLRRVCCFCLLFPCFTWSSLASAEEACPNPSYEHGHSYVHPLKYPVDFKNFAYANPRAPKGGILRMAQLGTFDSFNNMIDRGRLLAGYDLGGAGALIYDSLMTASSDEFSSIYGRLAEGIAVEPNFQWVAFKLRENAYWHDGRPITVEDVIFTFEQFKEIGSVGLKTALTFLDKVVQIGEWEVCFVTNKEVEISPIIPFTYGGLGILPKHYWTAEGKDLSETTVEPPLGSGPYQLDKWEFGINGFYKRVEDYWGSEIPVMKGRYNFETIKWDYFRDEHVMVEALKADTLDFREETVSKNWTIKYDFAEVKAGIFKRELRKLNRTWGMWWPAFWNVRIERFQDRRVREALFLLYDFPYTNRVILHGFYDYGNSYFYNSEMAWEGLPSEDELELLEPIRDQIPARVFTHEFEMPESSGFGINRNNVKRALELFEEAGWVVRNGELRHIDTNEQFKVDFVFVSAMLLRALSPYAKRLEQVGIDTTSLAPELSHWLHRMRARKFDGGGYLYIPSNIPGLELRNHFSSLTADSESSQNWLGLKDPAVDYLIEKVVQARNLKDLLAATRAFDRVMLWNFYHVPGMGQPGYRAVYWDRFGEVRRDDLDRVPVIDTWWWDEEKEARLQAGLKNLADVQ